MSALLRIMRSATAASRSIARFLREEEGPTTVEYCVMLSMILMVAFVAIAAFGNKTNAVLNGILNGLHAIGL
jgi:pilus assembly protein Flp/PilA